MKKFFLLFIMTGLFLQSCFGQKKPLAIGDTVPNFSLRDQDDSLFNIKDYIGKKILVIYFYPKDESLVCTKEACTFRDSITAFTKAGAAVIGINSGSVQSHREFQQKYKLLFTLLSDPEDKVMKMFGIKSGVISGRVTFIIDRNGKIVFTFNSLIHGPEHAQKALEFIRKMVGNSNK